MQNGRFKKIVVGVLYKKDIRNNISNNIFICDYFDGVNIQWKD